MNRFFSKKQREALKLWSLGKCSICGAILRSDFHADHITPYSKGGITDVTNGQALCAACNLKKGNKVAKFELRNWQKEAITNVKEAFSDKQKFFLAHATPGGGKTIFALKLFEALKKQGLYTHVIVLAPTSSLIDQWVSEASSICNFQLKTKMLHNMMPDFMDYRGICMTYQGMNEISEIFRLFCNENKTLVVADEMHHLSDGKSWGNSFQNAFDGAENIIALTGTPWASGGRKIPYVHYDAEGYAKPDFSYGKARAIADGVCRTVQFHKMKPENLGFSNRETGEYIGNFKTLDDAIEANVPNAYLKTLQSVKHMTVMFRDGNKQITRLRRSGKLEAGGLIVCPDIKTANTFRDEIFRLTGEDFPIVHSKMDKPKKVINDFRTSNIKWLISVGMVTEGVDIKRLMVCLFLAHKNTELLFRQVVGRIERVINKKDALDKYSYFYYTDIEELNEIVKKLEVENQAGLELIDYENCEKCKKNPCICDVPPPIMCPICNQKPCVCEKEIDHVFLEEVKTASNGLIAHGHAYDVEIVKEAILRQRSSIYLCDLELFIVCKFILSEREAKSDNDFEDSFNDEIPLADKIANTRAGITQRINAKLGKHLERQPTGKEISQAHISVNKRCAIRFTDDNTSYSQLQDKLDYINQTDASKWFQH